MPCRGTAGCAGCGQGDRPTSRHDSVASGRRRSEGAGKCQASTGTGGSSCSSSGIKTKGKPNEAGCIAESQALATDGGGWRTSSPRHRLHFDNTNTASKDRQIERLREHRAASSKKARTKKHTCSSDGATLVQQGLSDAATMVPLFADCIARGGRTCCYDNGH